MQIAINLYSVKDVSLQEIPVPLGRQVGGICSTSCGNDTVNTRSRNFSLTNRRNTLNGALNQRGAVTMSTFFSLAG